MRKELDHLWTVERPKVCQGVAEAAAEGDRSENAEYIYGKKKLREIDRKVRYLSKRLEELKVVTGAGERKNNKVYFGAWVKVENEDGEERTFRIVGPDETDLHPHGISIDSPVARALMRKEIDDEVIVKRPRGDIVYTILEVAYEAFDETA